MRKGRSGEQGCARSVARFSSTSTSFCDLRQARHTTECTPGMPNQHLATLELHRVSSCQGGDCVWFLSLRFVICWRSECAEQQKELNAEETAALQAQRPRRRKVAAQRQTASPPPPRDGDGPADAYSMGGATRRPDRAAVSVSAASTASFLPTSVGPAGEATMDSRSFSPMAATLHSINGGDDVGPEGVIFEFGRSLPLAQEEPSLSREDFLKARSALQLTVLWPRPSAGRLRQLHPFFSHLGVCVWLGGGGTDDGGAWRVELVSNIGSDENRSNRAWAPWGCW